MKTFKKIAACALIGPMTLGAASVYAHGVSPDRTQDPYGAQQPAEERRGADETQLPGARQQDRSYQADRSDRTDRAHRDSSKEKLTRAPDNAFHAESLIGQDIKSQTGDNDIGSVKDLLISEDGEVLAVIVGVGGMLGIGEKDVAIRWDSIQHTRDEDGESRFTTSMTESSLEEAPEYDHDAK